ncbi:MAG: Membrane dipeptidase [Oscillospiraceae bacterium]|jgi:membrane dipeptidase|nr:Membrane dipeptidase [Oscillospiraceae bacterium]
MRLFDMHCDTVYECVAKGRKLDKNDLNISLERGKFLEKWVQTFAFWISDSYRGQAAYDLFLKQYHFFLRESEQNENLVLFGSKTDIQQGKCTAMLGVEGGAALGGDIERVADLKQKGISILTLCWNGDNEIAGGVYGQNNLTPFGKDVVAEMESEGIVVDVSHLNEKSFYDVEKVAKKPFVASHSNTKAVCNHPRNLTDDQIRIISERGGLVGINFYTEFLSEDKDPDFDDIMRHIEHFLNIGGEEFLALGSDFDGATMPKCLNSIRDIEKLYQVMVQCFGNDITEKIMYQNSYDFYKFTSV